MASRRRRIMVALLASLAMAPAYAFAGDDGELLFRKNCLTCHTVEKGGAKRQGPNLWAVIGRRAGSVTGFPYSKGLKNADWPWTAETLNSWLANPKAVFADSYMMYRQADPEVRRKIITYLQAKTD